MKKLKKFGKVLLILVIIVILMIIMGLMFLRFYPSVGNIPGKEKQKEFAMHPYNNDTAAELIRNIGNSGKNLPMLYRINSLNFDDHSNYNSLINKAIDKVIKMKSVFKNRVK